jgi:hypothetical protein
MEELQGYMYETPASPTKPSRGHTNLTYSKDLSKEEGGQGEKV